jgi:RNA polymerase sigma factor (sigma-70 family)
VAAEEFPAEPSVETVIEAQRGDQRALDDLVAGYLPLIYNVVGHALGGHADTDDVVQETMLRAVHGLTTLRDPASFRSWLVVIAMNLVRDRHRQPRPAAVDDSQLADVADPGADFVDLTILRLQLSGERREVVAATRWLSEDERELLALWWLEAAGRLTRAEVAQAAGLSPQHTAVRIQRMKAQLDAARVVVRALQQAPPCPRLGVVLADWDNHPSALWRKRIGRHVRECRQCGRHVGGLTAAEALVARLSLVPVPAGLASHAGITSTPTIVVAKPAAAAGKATQLWHTAALKPLVAGIAAIAVAATAVAILAPRDPAPAAQALVVPTATPEAVTGTVPATSSSTASTTSTTGSTTGSTIGATTPATSRPSKAPPVVPAGKSVKKGISTWYFAGVTQALDDVRAGWYYTWDASPGKVAAPAGVQFVPMIWGAKSVDQATLNRARSQGSTLLGFNEPDMAGQANMTVEQALDLWPQLQATGMRLGSPAVAFDGDKAGGWLDRFMSGAAARGLRVDFVTLHWYGGDFSSAAAGQLQRYIDAVHARYGKPVWLTEYSLIDFSGPTPRYPDATQLAAFAHDSSAMLDRSSAVERYAWFALPVENKPGTGLYVDGTTPNAAGIAYRDAG